MYTIINKELSQQQQHIYRLQNIELMLATLRTELSDLEKQSQLLKSILEKEHRDYEKMTETNIITLFHSILGSLEGRTEKERQEAVEAQLKYHQCICDLEDVQSQISKLGAEKLQYKNAVAEYDKLYHQKLQLLTRDHHAIAQEVMELDKQVAQSKANQREIAEAIQVGLEVEKSLSATLKHLDSAESWGVWDMVGGGLLTDIAKHSHIDDAANTAQQTQRLLRRFRTELADVRISAEIPFDISCFAKFADFFFDGLISDWFMQSKINATQESVRRVQQQVQSVMRKLRELEHIEKELQKKTDEQIKKLIVKA